MRNGFRFHAYLMGALAVTAVCAFAAARGADDPPKEKPFKTVTFNTADGVKLEGNLWSNASQPMKKDATVLLLHNFDVKKGGNSHEDGWDDLAEKLQKEGYTVFSFDFRGFGNSTTVVPDQFWMVLKNPHNRMVKGFGKSPPPDTIDHTGFEAAYYPYLVNDISAAKAFLDRRNDQGELNTSSVFVVGAGEGATLGAMWMAAEWHRRKADVDNLGRVILDTKTGLPNLDDAEGKDEAGAVWLTLSPTLAGRHLEGVAKSWVSEVGGQNKVPIGLFYGADDDAGKGHATRGLDGIYADYRRLNGDVTDDDIKEKKLIHTRTFGIENTSLKGSKLLTDGLPTAAAVVKFVNVVMDKRHNLEARTRDAEKAAYYWHFLPGQPILAKQPNETTMPLVPVTKLEAR